MFSRLACPACGSSIESTADTAGRIVPCPGCGRNIQMPAAPRPPARGPEPLSLDDDRDVAGERAPRRAASPRSRAAAGRSLLWLWVLLGTSTVGLAVGAGLFLLLGWNAKPQEPELVAEKPLPQLPKPEPKGKQPGPAAAPGPRPAPAPIDSPLTAPNAGGVATATAEEIRNLAVRNAQAAPKPPDAVVPPKPPAGIAAAEVKKGLRFHLACDKVENGAVLESVSGKFVGKSRKVELIDGPRGKAIRTLAGGGPGAVREGLDLSAHVDALAVGEGKPFTLTLWARTDEWGDLGNSYINATFYNKDKFRHFYFYQYTQGVGFYLSEGVPGRAVNIQEPKTSDTRELEPTKEWIHLAVSRDERGVFRWAVNGKVTEIGPAVFTGEVRFNEFSLGWQQGNTFTADFDEFCLFDRVLTDDEIKKLAAPGK